MNGIIKKGYKVLWYMTKDGYDMIEVNGKKEQYMFREQARERWVRLREELFG
ncbi:MAG: hypothetical protein M0P69_19085 [Bacteroidales bacterium]|nr:hypothetical protein [Bacteroidales bacterium]